MQISEIHITVSQVKPVTLRQCWRYIQALEIKPLGVRQRPQVYPPDTARRILNHLGLAPAAPKSQSTKTARRAKLPTLAALRRAKLKAK